MSGMLEVMKIILEKQAWIRYDIFEHMFTHSEIGLEKHGGRMFEAGETEHATFTHQLVWWERLSLTPLELSLPRLRIDDPALRLVDPSEAELAYIEKVIDLRLETIRTMKQ
jgi:hypothetical protein